ncbi:2851_t:CDS:1, partial [Gigaspora rosea]
VKANQAEILCWRSFIIGLDKSVDEILIKEKVGMKKVKGLIYDFILAHNPDTKRKTLYQRISRARKVYEFTEKIGIDKIKYIKTYNANSIAELSDSQIQTIIDYFSKNLNTELPGDQDDSIIDSEGEISDDQTNASEAQANSLVSAKASTSISLTHVSNSSVSIPDYSYDENKINDMDTILSDYDDDEGYYYNLNTGETYGKSDRPIYAY